MSLPHLTAVFIGGQAFRLAEALGKIAGRGKAHQLADLRQTVTGVAQHMLALLNAAAVQVGDRGDAVFLLKGMGQIVFVHSSSETAVLNMIPFFAPIPFPTIIATGVARPAVANTPEGRADMALGQYVAGMGFSNVGLGIVHSMAHPLGALYDTPHGVANAIILPTVMEYNAPATGEKYREIARAMGVQGVDSMTQEEYRKAAIDAVRKLSEDVGIPADLKAIVKEEDIPFLAQSAYDDACRPGNPRETSVEEIAELYKSLI